MPAICIKAMMHIFVAAGEAAHFDIYIEYLSLCPIPHSFFTEMVDNTFPLGRI